jgi:uncharacterized SAM-binding protein YcdF (DUF218 family)
MPQILPELQLVLQELSNLSLENGQVQMLLLQIKRKKQIVWFVSMTTIVILILLLPISKLMLLPMLKVKILSIGYLTNQVLQ